MVNWHGPKPARKFHSLVQEAGIEVESVSPRHVEIAIGALALYGVRFIYALAKPWDCGSFSAANSLTALMDKALGRVRRRHEAIGCALAGRFGLDRLPAPCHGGPSPYRSSLFPVLRVACKAIMEK